MNTVKPSFHSRTLVRLSAAALCSFGIIAAPIVHADHDRYPNAYNANDIQQQRLEARYGNRQIGRHHAGNSAANHSAYGDEYGVVLEATPIYERRQDNVVCQEERVYSNNNNNAVAGTLAGAVVGGVIGHQFGSGRGNDVATVAGVLLGASAGREATINHSEQRNVQTVTRCQNRYSDGYGHAVPVGNHRPYYSDYSRGHGHGRGYSNGYNSRYSYVNQVVGYNVVYRYRGRVYSAVTSYFPGETIAISGVQPIVRP